MIQSSKTDKKNTAINLMERQKMKKCHIIKK